MWICDIISSTEQEQSHHWAVQAPLPLPRPLCHPSSVSGQLPSRSHKDGCSSNLLQISAQVMLMPSCHNLGFSHCYHPENNGWNLWWNLWLLFCFKKSVTPFKGSPFDFGSYSTISRSACQLEEEDGVAQLESVSTFLSSFFKSF